MKILICDTLDIKALKELQTIGKCIDISSSNSKDEDLNVNIIEVDIVVVRSETKLTRELIEKGKNLYFKSP